MTTRCFLVLAVASCFGCSFAFVTGPPSEPPSDPREPVPECTTSLLFPIGDTVVAGIAAGLVVAHATSDENSVAWYGDVEPETAMWISAAQFAAFGSGSVYGFIQTSRCKSYREKAERAPPPTWSPARHSAVVGRSARAR